MSKYTYLNRELSFLKFNERVLLESTREELPLLERGKFISIAQSNLDEFFMVRVGKLVTKVEEKDEREDISGDTPQEQLEKIKKDVRIQVKKLYGILNESFLPALAEQNIHIVRSNAYTKAQKKGLEQYFEDELMHVITPRAIHDKRPFPLLKSKQMHVAVLLKSREDNAFRFMIVPLPSTIKRLIPLETIEGQRDFALLEDVVGLFASKWCQNSKVVSAAPFRITRNADFEYNDSDAELLIQEMQDNLQKRKWGEILRLEVEKGFDPRLHTLLKKYMGFKEERVYSVEGFINPSFFMKEMCKMEGFENLLYPPFVPYVDDRVKEEKDIFAVVSKGDLLLHHPYDSFDTVVQMINQAADDENVLAIKQTLYRVSGKSPIVAALKRAVENGKQVTVLIEVRARFDEENNINWCFELEKAGCSVIYGVPNYKTHSKITLIIRKEREGIKKYVHLGTGNYNDVTAKIYSDFGLITCDPALVKDASLFFNWVTGYQDEIKLHKIISAPKYLRDTFEKLIKQEMKNCEAGLPASIIAKCNAVTDKKMIKLLYKAADQGVHVHMIVRSACCLSVKKHKNITVHSIVGRFLEHARVYIFENGGDKKVFMSSADFMTRNLDKRVELMFPIEEPDLVARVVHLMALELSDNVQAWVLKKDGTYQKPQAIEPFVSAQLENMHKE